MMLHTPYLLSLFIFQYITRLLFYTIFILDHLYCITSHTLPCKLKNRILSNGFAAATRLNLRPISHHSVFFEIRSGRPFLSSPKTIIQHIQFEREYLKLVLEVNTHYNEFVKTFIQIHGQIFSYAKISSIQRHPEAREFR